MLELYIFIIIFNLIIILNFNFISSKLNVHDIPNKRKIHKKSTPSIGGYIILSNLLLIIVFNFFYNFIEEINYYLLFTFVAFFLLGLIDDKIDLNPYIKLIYQVLITFIFLITNEEFLIQQIRISFLDRVFIFDYYLTSILFTIFCVIVFNNAMNMFDGINLHSAFLIFFGFIFFIIINTNEIIKYLIFSVVCFSYLNFRNKCFLGNSGIYSVSFLLSIFFIESYNLSLVSYTDEIFIYMALPGIDMIRLFILRIKNKKNPFIADKNHIHHILLTKTNYANAIFLSFANFFIPVIVTFYLNTIYGFFVFLIIYFFNIKKN